MTELTENLRNTTFKLSHKTYVLMECLWPQPWNLHQFRSPTNFDQRRSEI